MPGKIYSFGKTFSFHHEVKPLFWPPRSLQEILPADSRSCLPYAHGRSYGDSCLNADNLLFATAGLDRMVSFDREQGIIRCEAGVSLGQLLRVIVPAGWFLPVLPGTAEVSVAGAVANDIHGKNHHRRGSFGCHVRSVTLLRSSGEQLECSPHENAELYRATIGGLGLTGLITSVALQLRQASPLIRQESRKFKNLDEFFTLSSAANADCEYTVAWMDLTATGSQLGRGLFLRGDHYEGRSADPLIAQTAPRRLSIPWDAPGFLLSRPTITLFNWLYYHRQWKTTQVSILPYHKFFFPLDGIKHWNRLYGKRGLYQYQLVIPTRNIAALPRIFELISRSKMASFLAVFKEFGPLPSPGMLSFPREGYTLALDFANYGEALKKLFYQLDALVVENAGRLYPAKDAHMNARDFKTYYPQWQEFSQWVDPRFSSSFWRRVSSDEQ